jgi:hypothetical protein
MGARGQARNTAPTTLTGLRRLEARTFTQITMSFPKALFDQNTLIAHQRYVNITTMNIATDSLSWLLACIYLTRQYFTTRLNLSFFCFMLPYL